MRAIIAGTLVLALPGLVAIGLQAASKPRAAPVPIAVTGQVTDDAGHQYALTGTLTPVDVTPLPPPLALSSLTVSPRTVSPGQGATGTVTLSRAPLAPVQIALKALDKGLTVAATVTLNTGQVAGTFAIGTPGTQATPYWYSLSATYNGQSLSASLLVQPDAAPGPGPLAPVSPVVDAATGDGPVLTVLGRGFGEQAGTLWWGGYPCAVTAWSDTKAVGTVLTGPLAGYGWYGVGTTAGGFSGGLVAPSEPWPEPPEAERR